ncbi:MAG: GAF domain-containing protein [Chloroflexi bacterium]|nr:GAF domain-containing protein [Chloroflexota bacterium]
MRQDAVETTTEMRLADDRASSPGIGVPRDPHEFPSASPPNGTVASAPIGLDAIPDDLRTILEGIAAGVTVQEERGRLLFVNDDAARMAGFLSPAEMLAATPGEIVERFELIGEDGVPFDQTRLPGRRVLAGEDPDSVLVGFRPRNEPHERWSLLQARAATLGDGRRVAINTFHDVTSRVETERQIRASERQTLELAEDRRRAGEIARILADAALRLEEARHVNAVAQAAVDAMIPAVADWSVVDLLRPDGALRRVARAALDHDLQARLEPLWVHASAPDRESPSRHVLTSGDPLVVLDMERSSAAEPVVDREDHRIVDAIGIRSFIIQPIVARGSVVGSIAFVTVRERTFDSAGVAATAEIANRVGLAIANVESYQAEQRARRAAEQLADRMERLQAVTRTLADATEVEDVAAIVADEARRALDADSVVLGLLDDATASLNLLVRDGPVATTGDDVRSMPVAAADPLATAVRENRPVWVEGDVAVDREARVSACALPLVADQKPLGGIVLGFRGRRTFAPEDQRLVRAYADLAAGAIVRLRLGGVRQHLLAANELERSRLESVLRQMPIGVMLATAPEGRFVYANEAARRLWPTPLDVGGTSAGDANRGFRPDGTELKPEDWPLRRAMAGETVENEIVEVVGAGGTRRTFGLSAAPIPGPTGSIESAVLTYTDVTDRIRAQEREGFLARASEVLASSLDYEKTVQAVADLAVPAFADWCVVQLASEEGAPRRIAVAHRDPDKVALAIRVQEEYPPDPEASIGAAAVLRTGRSEFVADISPEIIDAAARDEHHREMLQMLQLRSYVAVPLIAAGRILGVLTLVGSESGRHFEPGDVAFAEALAARAAAAIDNARLFREGVRFKRLLDATGDAILMLDPLDGQIAYANRGAAEQLERSVEDLIGSSMADHLAPSGVAILDVAMLAMAKATTDSQTLTLDLLRPGGSTLPVEVRLEYVATDGAPPRILAIARDIRDRILAQERLRRLAAAEHSRAAELKAVIQAMGDGIAVCDRDGRIILANPAAEDTFPDVEETTYAEILAQLDDPDDLAPGLGVRGGPVELRVSEGDERWIEVSTWPVGAGRDRPTTHDDETIVLLRDVTEQRQRQAVRDTFIGVLSHELRTPVTTIYAGAKVLARPGELSDSTREEIFADIVIESERLHRLVEDVVAMTRFGDEGGDVGAEPVLLQRLLPGVVKSEDGRWPDVTFDAVLSPGLPTVIADPTYVEQVVRNLLSNAAKYGGPGAMVTVTVEAVGDEVLVRILDAGPGFPTDESERLFELFFRSAGTARAAAGAGIGLFVCARLIRAMGGRIWALNRPTGGAEFGFALRIMSEDG